MPVLSLNFGRLLSSTLALSTLLLLASAQLGIVAQAQSLQDKIKNKQPVVVATEDDYRPFEFMQDGKPAGLDNELFQLLKAEAKFDLRQEILPWTGLLAGVSSGKYDAAVTAAPSSNSGSEETKRRRKEGYRDRIRTSVPPSPENP